MNANKQSLLTAFLPTLAPGQDATVRGSLASQLTTNVNWDEWVSLTAFAQHGADIGQYTGAALCGAALQELIDTDTHAPVLGDSSVQAIASSLAGYGLYPTVFVAIAS